MNLKNKISLIVSLLFTTIFAVSATVIYLSFADFRKEEFESRLEEKALSSIKLLVEVKQVDRQLLKIIDENSIHKLFDEKTLIFDSNYKLIYSSLDDTKINWRIQDLDYLKKNKTLFRNENNHEIYGVFYKNGDNDYYALISASDKTGRRKLEYLLFILISTYVTFSIICWYTITYIINKSLFSIDTFLSKIKGINENNLNTRIILKNNKDEIDLLAQEFNLMLERIDRSYQTQKEFTAQASHELRTPISRLTARIENKLLEHTKNNDAKEFLSNLLKDVNQLSELVTMLLLLARLDNSKKEDFEICRIDEIIFEASDATKKLFKDFKLQLDIEETDTEKDFLETKANKSLLILAFSNLLSNAYSYSDNHQAAVLITAKEHLLTISIMNDGKTLSEFEQTKLFQSFMRGNNSQHKPGLGLGLKIVQRILIQHHAEISYQVSIDNKNLFTVSFLS